MSKSSTIRNEDEAKRLAKYLLAAPKPVTVTIRAGSIRTLSQNALSHLWYADIARDLNNGWTVSDARANCKLYIGIRILHSENEAFREKWNRLIRGRYSTEELLELMLPPHDYPVTRIMNKSQMQQYMDTIVQKFASQGVRLTDPENIQC